MIKKSVLDAPKLYGLQENKSACVFCSFKSTFYFICDKIYADNLKYEITSSLKANNRLKFYQDLAFNRVINKGKLRCKLSYKLFKE